MAFGEIWFPLTTSDICIDIKEIIMIDIKKIIMIFSEFKN